MLDRGRSNPDIVEGPPPEGKRARLVVHFWAFSPKAARIVCLPMPPIVIDIRNAEDARDVVHRAVQALAEGQLIALPTETVYGLAASACRADAVERLLKVKGRGPAQPLTLAIKSAEEAPDFVPDMSPLARRLARRCWPGPVTLVVDHLHKEGLTKQLPRAVRDVVVPNGSIGLRVPANDMSQAVLRMLSGPIVLSSANRTGGPDACTAQEVVAALDGDVALVLDDGPCRYGQPSSVVKVTNNQFKILREGVVGEATLRRLAGVVVLFVCTGNTCRSPMAELLMQQSLAKCLGCSLEELGGPWRDGDLGRHRGGAGLPAGCGSGAGDSRIRHGLVASRGSAAHREAGSRCGCYSGDDCKVICNRLSSAGPMRPSAPA